MAIATGRWAVTSEIGTNQALDVASSAQMHPACKRITCVDMGPTNYGEAEFVYLRGAPGLSAGDFVTYGRDGVVTRAAARAIGSGGVAMANVASGQWGWYQRTGVAKVAASAATSTSQMYLTSTPGQLSNAVVAGDLIYGVRSDSTPDTGFIRAVISYPYCGDTDNT